MPPRMRTNLPQAAQIEVQPAFEEDQSHREGDQRLQEDGTGEGHLVDSEGAERHQERARQAR